MKFFLTALYLCAASSALADILVPNRTIRPGNVITAGDILIMNGDHPDAFSNPLDVIGQEARVALYANRPIRFDHIGPPAIVERNQIVQLKYVGSTLAITTEGRSLERGAIGDRVRVMNLSSRSTVFGFIQPDSSIKVVQP